MWLPATVSGGTVKGDRGGGPLDLNARIGGHGDVIDRQVAREGAGADGLGADRGGHLLPGDDWVGSEGDVARGGTCGRGEGESERRDGGGRKGAQGPPRTSHRDLAPRLTSVTP